MTQTTYDATSTSVNILIQKDIQGLATSFSTVTYITTTEPHGLGLNDRIFVPAEKKRFTVVGVDDANTFAIHTEANAYAEDTDFTFQRFVSLKAQNFSGLSAASKVLDTTNLSSTSVLGIPGLVNYGNASFKVYDSADSEGVQLLKTARIQGTLQLFELFHAGSVPAMVTTFHAYVLDAPIDLSPNSLASVSISLLVYGHIQQTTADTTDYSFMDGYLGGAYGFGGGSSTYVPPVEPEPEQDIYLDAIVMLLSADDMPEGNLFSNTISDKSNRNMTPDKTGFGINSSVDAGRWANSKSIRFNGEGLQAFKRSKEFSLANCDWTIDFQIKMSRPTADEYFIVGTKDAYNNNTSWAISITPLDTLKLYFCDKTLEIALSPDCFDKWAHMEIGFSNTTKLVHAFTNGEIEGVAFANPTIPSFGSTDEQILYIGAKGTNTDKAFNGWLQDLRITKYIKRHDGAFPFVPPNGPLVHPYAPQVATNGLVLHLDFENGLTALTGGVVAMSTNGDPTAQDDYIDCWNSKSGGSQTALSMSDLVEGLRNLHKPGNNWTFEIFYKTGGTNDKVLFDNGGVDSGAVLPKNCVLVTDNSTRLRVRTLNETGQVVGDIQSPPLGTEWQQAGFYLVNGPSGSVFFKNGEFILPPVQMDYQTGFNAQSTTVPAAVFAAALVSYGLTAEQAYGAPGVSMLILRIYNRPISDIEIRDNYNAQKARIGR